MVTNSKQLVYQLTSSYLTDRSPNSHVQNPSNLHELDCQSCMNPVVVKNRGKLKLVSPNYILAKHRELNIREWWTQKVLIIFNSASIHTLQEDTHETNSRKQKKRVG
ncbi:hypothetical protein NC652_010474 [Populus alba x Populus x berolinensis]|nr:hypothetical protein NC652_010474 [Populus alba x Populus x berolinensis]